jgi:hypothetical protein
MKIELSLKNIFIERTRAKKGPLTLVKLPDNTAVSYYLIPLDEYTFLFEMKEKLNVSDEEIAALVYECYVSDNSKLDVLDHKAGHILYVSKQIIEDSSPYHQIEEKLDRARQVASTEVELIEQIKFTIVRAFPSYKIEELDTYNVDQLYKLFGRAESYLTQIYPDFKPLRLINKNEAKQALKPDQFAGLNIEAENKALRQAGFN